jgi:hypothetical protein
MPARNHRPHGAAVQKTVSRAIAEQAGTDLEGNFI